MHHRHMTSGGLVRHTRQKIESGRRWRGRLRRAATIALGALAAGVAVGGCGGGSSTPGVATVSSTPGVATVSTNTGATVTAAPGPAGGGGKQGRGLLAYASCMRSHGVPNFPDPSGSEGIPKQAVISAAKAVGNSQFEAAEHDCKQLLPAGGSLGGRPSRTVTAQDQQYYLKAATCMRSHGIADFPDPSFSNGEVEFHMLEHLVDIHSTQFTEAYQICRRLIPSGLPDSGPGR